MTTVLVVDDAALDRQIAGACIDQAGLTTIYANNGREALDVIASAMPDIVLTDLQMPELDGLELVRRVRENYPTIPTILMTAWGSEEIAVTALREGAASYVPKKNLKQDLMQALDIVMQSAQAAKDRQKVIELFRQSETNYVLGYQSESRIALVSHLQDALLQMDFCDEMEVIRLGTALTEALDNAVDHGNLELDSSLRDEADAYCNLGRKRAQQLPYRDRTVCVTARLTPQEATYIVRDDGPGFDVSKLRDPTDPENLLKPGGRGIMLIRVFMDEVSFNTTGNELTMTKRRRP